MKDLARIFSRVKDKRRDYARYNFSTEQDSVLKTFFDLAQEFESLDDLYRVCVAVPKAFFGLDTNLYLSDSRRQLLVLVCTSTEGYLGSPDKLPPAVIKAPREAFIEHESFFTPIFGKMEIAEVEKTEERQELLGMLEISPGSDLTASEQLFFQKYANRIGYSLYNRILTQRNIEHLKFIDSLVADIEHNVIVPNMAFRLFLRRLQGKICKNREIESMLGEKFKGLGENGTLDRDWQERVMAELREVNRGLEEEFNNIENHNRNISLFVESLFRRSHFQEGRFIPQKRLCNFRKEVIEPQLERLRDRFSSKGIAIDDQLGRGPEESVVAVVDVGLISQVYANLFSNALKYTRVAKDMDGAEKKFVAYGQEILADYFGSGRDGARFNVINTGPHIPIEERERIFEDGYRGSQAGSEPGTGHGLSFVKRAVEIHEGVVGYEPTPLGNNFYFILPK
ncbi:MAG: sensor histidine kinase [Deltaproteobacteria bacterium]|nr:MAG: sensor histidine kinase [Deltaproteobacteria bacterium]